MWSEKSKWQYRLPRVEPKSNKWILWRDHHMYYFVVVFKGEKIKIRETRSFLWAFPAIFSFPLFILLPLMLEMFHLSTAKLVNDQELQNWGTVAMEELHSPYFLSDKLSIVLNLLIIGIWDIFGSDPKWSGASELGHSGNGCGTPHPFYLAKLYNNSPFLGCSLLIFIWDRSQRIGALWQWLLHSPPSFLSNKPNLKT